MSQRDKNFEFYQYQPEIIFSELEYVLQIKLKFHVKKIFKQKNNWEKKWKRFFTWCGGHFNVPRRTNFLLSPRLPTFFVDTLVTSPRDCCHFTRRGVNLSLVKKIKKWKKKHRVRSYIFKCHLIDQQFAGRLLTHFFYREMISFNS